MTTQADEDSQAGNDAAAPEVLEGLVTELNAEGVPRLTQELLEVGKSAAIAIALWGIWTHRKVESLDLLSGERARRRVSVDCTPVMIPWQEAGIFGTGIDRCCLVPLTVIRKRDDAPDRPTEATYLKSLDVTDDAGRSVPVLGRRTNGLIAALSLAYWVSVDGSEGEPLNRVLERAQPHWQEIYATVMAPRDDALARAERLIKKLGLPATPAKLVEELAESFLLIAVLPEDAAQRRQVLKYSYHYEMKPLKGIVRRRILPAFGLSPLKLKVGVGAMRTAASYHLECAVPEGLTVTRISLPKSQGIAPTANERTKVAHVSGRYSIDDDGSGSEAWIRLLPDHNGLLPRIMWSGVAVAAIFAVLIFAPDLRDKMISHEDPAIAILLFIPAFLVGLNARSSENVVVGGLLLPLRIYALVLAGIVFVVGAMLVLNVWPVITTLSLWVAFVVGGLGALTSFIGWIPQVVRSRR